MVLIKNSCADVWWMILEDVAKEDWKPLVTTLPLINKQIRGIALEYLEKCILPILFRIQMPEATLSTVHQYQQIKKEVEKKIPTNKQHWKKQIHLIIVNLLRDIEGEDYLTHLKKLELFCDARADVNALTSQKQTPLLQICESLGTLYSNKRMSRERRVLVYQRILDITHKLLKAEADPNKQGFPSTPLVTILTQQPLSNLDAALMRDLVALLMRYGADLDLIPQNDLYKLNKSPRYLGQEVSEVKLLFNV